MENSARDNLLRSWKEIASYLGVDERTCARWEHTFSMPVHRAGEGSTKSHVFAYRDELDRWFRETFPVSGDRQAPGETPAAPPRRGFLRRTAVLAVMVVVVVAVFLAIKGMLPKTGAPGPPADFHLRGTKLAVLDEFGKELWVKDLHVEGLREEEDYRMCFQVASGMKGAENLPWIAIKDIDGDGRNETLFAVKRKTDAYGEGILICFDSEGNEKWRFAAGREMTYQGRVCSADYRLLGFKLHDINGDGRQEVFVVAFQYPWEPCQLAVLDSRGSLIGEFWNAGYFRDIVFADLDGDGHEELYAAGVNNEYGGGCVAVFDPADVHGASPQGAGFSFAGLTGGSELYYLDFPRTDVSLADGAIVAGHVRLDVTSNKRIQVLSHMNLIYELGKGMRCLNVRGGHGFVRAYNRLKVQGKVRSTLDDAYYEAIRKNIRYWNGTAMTLEPSMNLKCPSP